MNISFNKSMNNYPLKSTKDDNRGYYIHTRIGEPSFGGLEKTAESFANTLASSKFVKKGLVSKPFNNFLKSALENPGMFEALIALSITCTARPLTVLVTPGAKKEDKQYASAQSVASGITGLGFAYALFEPIKRGLDNIIISVNGENVKNTFVQFYNDPKNKKLIEQLVDKKVIPNYEEFRQELDKGNIFGYLKKYAKKSGAVDDITKILLGDDIAEQKKWADLSKSYSAKLKEIYEQNRLKGIEKKHHFLVHESLEFMNNGVYKLKTSAGADKTKYLINFSSKIILFPLTAAVMIWSIPKIMRIIFPNHRKSKSKGKTACDKNMHKSGQTAMKSATANTASENVTKSLMYKQFQKKPAVSQKQVSFSGLGSFAQKTYDKCYSKPLSSLFEKLFRKITLSDIYSKKINNLLENASNQKYQWMVPARDKSGKILKKADANVYISNLPNIAAIFGSCLYIINTIRNKEIESERKPALCTNMAVVAVFSLLASKYIEKKLASPIFDTLKKVHSNLIGNKLNYDHDEAWKCANKMLTSTFAFRYLGPVLATPAADKIVKLFEKTKEEKNRKSVLLK